VKPQQEKITSFSKLHCWQEGHKLVLLVFQITRVFPREQQFVLVSQMTRAAISITSNVAEGFSRGSFKEKLQFYYIAQGSLTELQNQLLISRDVGYISKIQFMKLAEQSIVVHKLLSGLIRYAKMSIKNI